jgi:uncharacterized protein (DUF2267 family)
MSHDDLLHQLRTDARFATPEEAERALTHTLETLGYLLPNPLVRELIAALPHACLGPLQAAVNGSDSARRLAHAKAACIPSELPPSTLAEMQAVCGLLFSVLPLDLMRKLEAALPAALARMFTRVHCLAGANDATSHVVTRPHGG